MYKKIVLFSGLFCSLMQHASQEKPTSCLRPWLEIKPSYFFFSLSPMNDIYDDGGFQVQVSTSVPVRSSIDFYGSIGFRKTQGRALNSGQKTSLAVIPIDIGLKPIFSFCETFYYSFAFGPRFFCFSQHNKSPYVDCKISDGGVGLFINANFNVQLADRFLIGFFGEYSYEKQAVCPCKPNVYSNGNVQIGGLAVGVSLGYAF